MSNLAPPPVRNCAECGAEFHLTSVKKIFCCHKCATRWHTRQRTTALREYVARKRAAELAAAGAEQLKLIKETATV